MVEPISTLQPWEDPRPQQVEGGREGTAAHGEPRQEEADGRNCSRWKGPGLEQFVKDYPVGEVKV